MKVNRGGYFENITADDLLALHSATPDPPGSKYWIAVASFAEYVEWVERLGCLGSERVIFSVPARDVKRIRRWTERELAIAGLNPS